MPTLIANWKLIAVLILGAALFFAGTHYQSLVDAKARASEIAAQEDADAKARDEAAKKSKAVELELAAERTKSADLQEQWEKERHAKSHTVCSLSAATLGLLQDAGR